MANGGIESSNLRILDAIRYFNFGALIEITNGVPNDQKRQEKKRMVREGCRLLKKSVGDEAEIAGGLAVIKYDVKEIKDLDFLVRLPNYDENILYTAAARVLETGTYLDRDSTQLLVRMMALADDIGPRSLSTNLLNIRKRGKRFENKTYCDHLAKVKGAVLEFYVRQLFGEVLRATDSVFALGTTLRDTQIHPRRTLYTDLVVACSASHFRRGLEALTQKYSGDRKITVEYPHG